MVAILKKIISWAIFLCLFATPALADTPPVNLNINITGNQRDTEVTFIGFCAPGALVTFQEDASIIGNVSANSSGGFNKNFTARTKGTHDYGIYAEDNHSRVTPTYGFILNLVPNAETVVSNILLPTTIDVQTGASVSIFGTTAPTSEVTIFVHSNPIVGAAVAGSDGEWDYPVGTLEPGTHTAYANTTLPGGLQGGPSRTVNFEVSGTYIVTEPVYATPSPTVSSGTHPDQNAWYNNNSPAFSWNKAGGITGFSYVFDQSAGTVPDTTVDTTDTRVSFPNTADGVWYLHIRALGSKGWSNTSHYRVQIDKTSPTALTVVTEPKFEADKRPMVLFTAKDATSGIDHYEIKLDNGEFKRAVSPYTPDKISFGEHTFTVRAFDKAGNMIEGKVKIKIAEIPIPKILTPKNDTTLKLAERLTISGTASIGTKIDIYLDDIKIASNIAVGEDGSWNYLYKHLIMPGEHSITAVAVKDGIESKTSDKIVFRVDLATISLFGIIIPTIVVFILLLFIIVLFVALAIWFFFLVKRKHNDKEENNRKDQELKKEIKDL